MALGAYIRQTGALLKKTLLIKARSWQVNLLLLLQSCLVILLIWLVNAAVTYSSNQFTGAQSQRSTPVVHVGPVPDCRSNRFLKHDQPCFSLIYTPAGDPFVEQLMSGVVASNDPPLDPQLVMGMSNQSEVDAYLLAHPQTVLAAVHFRQLDSKRWSYVLQTNDSVVFFKGKFQDRNLYAQLPVQVAVEREFARLALGTPQLPWRVGLRDFSHPSLLAANPTGRIAPVFLLASLMVSVVLFLQHMVGERESGLRSAMTSMGLNSSAYWSAVLVVEVLQAALNTGLLTLLAMAFRFDMATRNDPRLLFLLLFNSALSLTALAVVMCTLIRRSSLVVPAALLEFIVAWVFMLVLAFGLPYNGSSSQALVAVFSLFPWSILGKGMFDLADASTGTKAGISWAQRTSYCWANSPPEEQQAELAYWVSDCSMPLGRGVLVLLIQAACYLVLGLYLDAVVPQEPGGAPLMHWAAPLLPSTWLPRRMQGSVSKYAQAALQAAVGAASSKGGAAAGAACSPVGGDDVRLEQQLVMSVCQEWVSTGAGQGTPTPYAPTSMRPSNQGSTAEDSVSSCAVTALRPSLHQGVYLMGLSKRYWTGGLKKQARRAVQPEPRAASPPGINSTSYKLLGEAASSKDHAATPLQQEGGAQQREGETAGAFAARAAAGSSSSNTPTASTTSEHAASPASREGLLSGLLTTCLQLAYRPLRGATRLAAWLSRRRDDGWLEAVQPTWLSLPPGQCLCLLGPNGAGKTSLIKCLLGGVAPTGGDALVWGHSVRSAAGLAAARTTTGVCPQFDVLWPQLTALEHLLLFQAIKGTTHQPGASLQQQAQTLLDKVQLGKAAHQRAGTFSGGMRRRLSLAIALLGEPSLLVLDEPTTGLDPVSRRQVWSLLSEAKAGRSVLLTTHYMEEADVLGDRIGIFVRGALRCLGSGLQLKAQYGSGLRVAVGLTPGHKDGRSLAERCEAVRQLVTLHLSLKATAPPEEATQPAAALDIDTQLPSKDAVAHGGSAATKPDATSQPAAALSAGGAKLSTGSIQGGELEAVGRSMDPDSSSAVAAEEQPAGAQHLVTGAHYEQLQVPAHAQANLPAVFQALQDAAGRLGILDVQVGLASLEDVFLTVVTKA